MDDEEDVKKMMALIKSSQEDSAQDFQYDDFINCENIDVEENEESTCFDDNYDFCNFTSSTDISKLSSYDPRSTLKPEERLVIDSCSDQELKNLLLLNRTKNFQLMQLYKKLKDLLIQSQKDIIEKSELITNFLKTSKEQSQSSGAWRLAAPYFKDKKLYACPPNADTLRKKKNKELSVYDFIVTSKWSSLECEKLLRAVKLNYNINQQNDTLKKIGSLHKNCNLENEAELDELENRMEQLRSDDNSEIPPLNSDQHIDWMRVAEIFLQDRRTSSECKSFWHIYLHPHINKSPWSPEENEKLKNIATKHKFQNWDKVAEELKNNRTGFTTCMNYYSNLHERFKKGDFTHTEDAMITQLVQKHKMGNYIPWFKIAQHFKNRTRSQLHHRYTYYLSQSGKRKGKFTDAEDILLMILVDKFGRNYKKCSEYLPTRSMVQIRARYSSNLQGKLKKGSFTKEDDEIIMKYAEEHGDKSWSHLTKVLKRCRGQIRQRYITIKTYLEKDPSSTLATVPRRKHKMQEDEDSFNFLRMVADQFQNCAKIPTLQEIEDVLKEQNPEYELENFVISNTAQSLIQSNNPLHIDDLLTSFFSNSFKMNPAKCISSRFVMRAVNDVQTVLNILRVKLRIPDNFDEDPRLDNLDVAILNVMTEDGIDNKEVNDEICELLPPNLNSLVGLRNILIKFSDEKLVHQDIIKSYNSDIMMQLLNLSNIERSHVERDYKLFFKRFQTLFKWPAVMTLINPTAELQSLSSSEFALNKIQVKRTYSRADKSKADECPKKRIKLSELPSSSTKAVPLKLTPVTNKSVIEDLLRNKNKKLFCMQAVKCGSETRTVIKEIDFHTTVHKQLSGATSGDVKDTADNDIKSATSAVAQPATKYCDPSDKVRQKPARFVPGQGECIILDDDDDNSMSIMSVSDESIIDIEENDVEDLNKLEMFLKERCKDDISNEDDDLKDLQKLDDFLKEQEEIGMDMI